MSNQIWKLLSLQRFLPSISLRFWRWQHWWRKALQGKKFSDSVKGFYCYCWFCFRYVYFLTLYLRNFVHFYDVNKPFSSFSDLKKQFEVNPTSTRVEIGHQTELRCVPPAGLPPPRIYWLRGGQPLQSDTSVIVSSEGHLLISQARVQDSGNYTCVAENIAAKRMASSAQITVYGKFSDL